MNTVYLFIFFFFFLEQTLDRTRFRISADFSIQMVSRLVHYWWYEIVGYACKSGTRRCETSRSHDEIMAN